MFKTKMIKNLKNFGEKIYASKSVKYLHSSSLIWIKSINASKEWMNNSTKINGYKTNFNMKANYLNSMSHIRHYAIDNEENKKPKIVPDEKKNFLSKLPEWKVVKAKLRNLPAIIKDELIHYWTGLKLLFKNMKLSTQLIARILKGEKLKRSESALLERTVADTFRLVPFIIIAVVPFMEFSLPFLLKLFPNMLPSTFVTKDQKQQNMQKQIQARLNLAKFLQGATEKLLLEEIKGGITEEDFGKFTKKVKNGDYISNDEIIKIGRIFKNRFELESLSLERIQALCRFFGINSYGPRSYLIFQLNSKLDKLRNDDEQILNQGTEDLSIEGLVQINMDRGMKVEGRNRMMLIKQLYDWIQLSTHKDVPKFLLLLSRSFAVNQDSSAISSAINELTVEEIGDMIKDLPDEADELQKRLDELNHIEKEKKRLAKEKKEDEERKKKEEEESRKKKEEEERKRIGEEEQLKKIKEEEETRKALEEEKTKDIQQQTIEESEEKPTVEKIEVKQVDEKEKQDEKEMKEKLKEEIKDASSEQLFIHKLEDTARDVNAGKLADKIEHMIEKSQKQLDEMIVNDSKEIPQQVSTEKIEDSPVKIEEDTKIEDEKKLEEMKEHLEDQIESVSSDQSFIQELEDRARVPSAEKLTDKIEEMIERSKKELEQLQAQSDEMKESEIEEIKEKEESIKEIVQKLEDIKEVIVADDSVKADVKKVENVKEGEGNLDVNKDIVKDENKPKKETKN